MHFPKPYHVPFITGEVVNLHLDAGPQNLKVINEREKGSGPTDIN
jgi:hypothetical protein